MRYTTKCILPFCSWNSVLLSWYTGAVPWRGWCCAVGKWRTPAPEATRPEAREALQGVTTHVSIDLELLKLNMLGYCVLVHMYVWKKSYEIVLEFKSWMRYSLHAGTLNWAQSEWSGAAGLPRSVAHPCVKPDHASLSNGTGQSSTLWLKQLPRPKRKSAKPSESRDAEEEAPWYRWCRHWTGGWCHAEHGSGDCHVVELVIWGSSIMMMKTKCCH